MRHRVSIDSDGTDRGTTIHVDDKDITRGVRRYTFTGEIGEINTLDLEMAVFDVSRIDSEEADVLIPETTREALKQLGWTPPEE